MDSHIPSVKYLAHTVKRRELEIINLKKIVSDVKAELAVVKAQLKGERKVHNTKCEKYRDEITDIKSLNNKIKFDLKRVIKYGREIDQKTEI